MTERQWQQRITDLARLRGWRCFHPYDSRRSAPGFPDLTLVRGGRLIFAELKTDTGRLTVEQRGWIDALAAVIGVTAVVWRPSDWPTVVQELTR